MGRELKRVPLDFDWPLNKTWRGFINPHYVPCPEDNRTCFGGETAAMSWLSAVTRLICLLGEEAAAAPRAAELLARGRTYPHPYLQEWGTAPRLEMPRAERERIRAMPSERDRVEAHFAYGRQNPPQLRPLTPELLALVTGLLGHAPESLGSSDSYSLSKKLMSVAGMPEGWGICPTCKGEGIDPERMASYEAWRKEQPPTGDGFQRWETTSEGSPVSPVFASLDKLCAWCADNATTFGSETASAEAWRRMLDEDFVHHRVGNMVFV